MKNLLKLLRENGHVERAPLNFAKNETGEAVMYLYDVISDGDGWGIGALDVINALSQVEKGGTVRMRIKSPGGDVMEAKAIVTAMREFIANGGKIIAQIDSVAASCASWIAMTASEVEIAEGAFIMIHRASGGAFGTADELTKMANVITMVENSIVDLYAAISKQPAAQVQQWMAAETWFTADEAVANGFASKVTHRLADLPTNLAKLTWNLSAYDKVPEALKNVKPPEPSPELDVAAIVENNRRRLRLLDTNA
ncbi:head maturation protease, ClpP-related [Acidovorax sp.]|uniref:head maturation protease, ClpP-related n=1 Tax=Acidovorax sp. TaxID=1872122 RepID=UPI003CFE204D